MWLTIGSGEQKVGIVVFMGFCGLASELGELLMDIVDLGWGESNFELGFVAGLFGRASQHR